MKIDFELEVDCVDCNGSGMVSHDENFDPIPEPVVCLDCGGKGVVPTEAGEDLLLFIERWMVVDKTDELVRGQ